MQIEIHGETERLLKSLLATGGYGSAEEVIAEMAKTFQVLAAEDISRMPEHVDVDTSAERRGIRLIEDFRNLKADFSPPSDTTEEFSLSFTAIVNMTRRACCNARRSR